MSRHHQRFHTAFTNDAPIRPDIRVWYALPFWAQVTVTTVLTWFGFANPFLHLPPLVLAFPTALAMIALTATSPGQAFKQGWFLGMVVMSACLYWIVIPLNRYGSIPFLLALPCPLLLASVLALFTAVYTALVYLVRYRLAWPLHILFGGSLWACLEMIQGWVCTGFPWLTLPSALSVWPWAVSSVAFTGTYGLAGVLAALAMGAVYPGGYGKILVSLLFVAAILGLPLLNPPATETTDTLRAALVQGGIDQDHKWDPSFQNATVQTYVRLSQQAVSQEAAQLLIWPETAMPFYVQEDNELSRKVLDLVRQTQTPLILGAPGYTVTKDNALGYTLFNRAFLISPNGRITSWYDKQHLVPFGEYVPLASRLPFIHKLVVGSMDFSPGMSSIPLVHGNLALGILICYEAIFPELAQECVSKGANLLVNISNDTWFGASSAPWQHLYLSVLRAIEQNRFLIRCTNTGISAFIDNHGHILDTSELFKEQILVWDHLIPLTATTWYHTWYTYIHTSYAVLPLILGCWAWTRPSHLEKRPW